MSVDLAGSTAFKAGPGRDPAGQRSPHPLWIVAIRKFYEAFPPLLESHFHVRKKLSTLCRESSNVPKLWKTIGDEIVFCCRVDNSDHLSVCIHAFIQSLKEYGAVLSADGHLDVKGTSWIAPFPAVNMTATRSKLSGIDYLLEEFEVGADNAPSNYDFLGPEIDAGFRVAKHSSPDKCAISVQLAWLLTRHAGETWPKSMFVYVGRDSLKGVINDKPYPIICLNTERNPRKAELRRRETRITGRAEYDVEELRDFIFAFMESEGMEFPWLFLDEGTSLGIYPTSYRKFQEQAVNDLRDINRQEEQLEASGEAESENESLLQTEMPEVIEEAARQTKSAHNINETPYAEPESDS